MRNVRYEKPFVKACDLTEEIACCKCEQTQPSDPCSPSGGGGGGFGVFYNIGTDCMYVIVM